MTRSSRDALRRVLAPPILWRSVTVAVLVGTVLNLINQGDALIGGHGVIWWKIALTYCVPFLVASFGSYSALRTL